MTAQPTAILGAISVGYYIAGGALLALLLGAGLAWCYRWPRQGSAMVYTGLGGGGVSFDGMLVLPFLRRFQWLDVTLRKIELTHRGADALQSADSKAVELRAAFIVHIRRRAEDVKAAIDHFTIQGAQDTERIAEAFSPSLAGALEQTISQYDQTDLYSLEHQEQIRQQLTEFARACMAYGFALDSVAMELFEPVHESQLADGPREDQPEMN